MFYVILMGIISLFIAIFVLQNAALVEVSFLFWHFSMNLALIILGCFFLGFLVASLWTLKIKAGHFMRDRKLKGKIRELEEKTAERNETGTAAVPTSPMHRTYTPSSSYDAKKDTDPIIKPFRPKD